MQMMPKNTGHLRFPDDYATLDALKAIAETVAGQVQPKMLAARLA